MISFPKRLFSLFFLVVILFITVGNYGILVIIKQQVTNQIIQKIEGNAEELNGNLVFTFPITLPYSTDSEEYTRVDGEIVYGGEVYRLVKQRLYQGTLYVVCIKDKKSKWANKLIGDFAKSVSGQTQDGNSTVILSGSLTKYYVSIERTQYHTCKGWCQLIKFIPFTNFYSFSNSRLIFRPPLNC